jgi:hypothetical protein
VIAPRIRTAPAFTAPPAPVYTIDQAGLDALKGIRARLLHGRSLRGKEEAKRLTTLIARVEAS